MTIPNLITSLRIILTPVFIIFLINDKLTSALIFFILAGISDALDGAIARLFDQKSKLGAFLDPLADKLLLASSFVMLAVKGYIYPWLTVIVISRDIMISLGILILFFNSQDFTIRPAFFSKITTCLQLICVFMVLFSAHFQLPYQVMEGLFWMTALMTIISGLHYMVRWFKMMGEGPLHD
jgi:cardiolipin synthase